MARMYSRKKGKAGSKKPEKKVKKTWLNYTSKEIEKIIIKLHKEEKTQSQIGMILRDTYGIPDVSAVLNKKINDVLKENNLQPKLPDDLSALIKKHIMILKHMEKNKKDMPSKRGLQLTESKILRLSKYYKKAGKLPSNWKFDRETARLLIG
jgi:small subunit ribosomal protein S15